MRSTYKPTIAKSVLIPFGKMLPLKLKIRATPEEQRTLAQIIRQLEILAPQLNLHTLHKHTTQQFVEQIKHLLELDCMLIHQASLRNNTRTLFVQLIHQIPDGSIQTRYWRHMDHKKERACLDVKIKTINAELSNIGAISLDSHSAQHNNRPLISPHATYKTNLHDELHQLLTIKLSSFAHDFAVFRGHLSKAKNTPYVQFDRLIEYLNHDLQDILENYFKNNNTSRQTNTLHHYLEQCQIRITQPLPAHLQSQLDRLLVCYDNEHNVALSRRINRKFDFLTALSDTIQNNPEKNYAECYHLVEASSRPTIQALVSEKSRTLFAKHRFKDFITELLAADTHDEQLYTLPNTDLNNPSHDDAGRFSC
jgi:hypothetical protein